MGKKIVSLGIAIVHLLILCLGLFAFTSTIKLLPWYEPLTMGAAFIVIFLIGVQLIVSMGTLVIYNWIKPLKNGVIYSSINAGLLVTIIVATEVYQPLFYVLAIIYSFVEIYLIVEWIKLSIKIFKYN